MRAFLLYDTSELEVIPAKTVEGLGESTSIRRVAAYVRVSTDNDEQTSSYELQKNYYTDYIKAQPGWEFVGIYDDEGISGTSLEHRKGMLGYRISFEGETLYVFDLLVPEIFHEGQKRKNETDQKNAQETKPANTRKGFYPDDIAGTFGVPVEEHLKESEVKQMDGYVSVGMLTGKTVPDTGLD